MVLRGKAARKSNGVLRGGQVGKVVYARADPRHPPEMARAAGEKRVRLRNRVVRLNYRRCSFLGASQCRHTL